MNVESTCDICKDAPATAVIGELTLCQKCFDSIVGMDTRRSTEEFTDQLSSATQGVKQGTGGSRHSSDGISSSLRTTKKGRHITNFLSFLGKSWLWKDPGAGRGVTGMIVISVSLSKLAPIGFNTLRGQYAAHPLLAIFMGPVGIALGILLIWSGYRSYINRDVPR